MFVGRHEAVDDFNDAAAGSDGILHVNQAIHSHFAPRILLTARLDAFQTVDRLLLLRHLQQLRHHLHPAQLRQLVAAYRVRRAHIDQNPRQIDHHFAIQMEKRNGGLVGRRAKQRLGGRVDRRALQLAL